jgi:hypothetical protein
MNRRQRPPALRIFAELVTFNARLGANELVKALSGFGEFMRQR